MTTLGGSNAQKYKIDVRRAYKAKAAVIIMYILFGAAVTAFLAITGYYLIIFSKPNKLQIRQDFEGDYKVDKKTGKIKYIEDIFEYRKEKERKFKMKDDMKVQKENDIRAEEEIKKNKIEEKNVDIDNLENK